MEFVLQLTPSLDNRQKVVYAALHLNGEADTWYQSLQLEHHDLLWVDFTISGLSLIYKGDIKTWRDNSIN